MYSTEYRHLRKTVLNTVLFNQLKCSAIVRKVQNDIFITICGLHYLLSKHSSMATKKTFVITVAYTTRHF